MILVDAFPSAAALTIVIVGIEKVYINVFLQLCYHFYNNNSWLQINNAKWNSYNMGLFREHEALENKKPFTLFFFASTVKNRCSPTSLDLHVFPPMTTHSWVKETEGKLHWLDVFILLFSLSLSVCISYPSFQPSSQKPP